MLLMWFMFRHMSYEQDLDFLGKWMYVNKRTLHLAIFSLWLFITAFIKLRSENTVQGLCFRRWHKELVSFFCSSGDPMLIRGGCGWGRVGGRGHSRKEPERKKQAHKIKRSLKKTIYSCRQLCEMRWSSAKEKFCNNYYENGKELRNLSLGFLVTFAKPRTMCSHSVPYSFHHHEWIRFQQFKQKSCLCFSGNFLIPVIKALNTLWMILKYWEVGSH